MTANGGDYQFSWNTYGDSVTFTVEAATTNWVAIGFSETASMVLSDIVVGATDGMSPFVEDRYVGSSQEEPSIDVSQDITDTSVTVSGGRTTIMFTRAIDTGDSNDFTLDQLRYILWAYDGPVTYNNPNVIGQHAMANRGIFDTQLNFSACDVVSFASAEVNTNEGDGTVTVCAAVEDGSADAEISGRMSALDVLAVAGSDYNAPASTTYVIPAGMAQGCLDFAIFDDDAIEGTHSFSIHLSISTPGVNIGGLVYSTVTITDNDNATVSLQMPSAVAEDGSSADVCVAIDGIVDSTEVNIVVNLEISDGTAVADNDYIVSGTMITVPSGTFFSVTQCIQIMIVDDILYEGDEYLNIAIAGITPSLTVGTPSMVQLTILDNEEIILAFDMATQIVTEAGGSYNITLVSTSTIDLAATLPPIELDLAGSATNGTDYVLMGPISFPNVRGSGLIITGRTTIHVYDDQIIEESEFVAVATASLPSGITIGSPSLHTITITDNEPTSTPVEFEFSKYIGEEGATVSVCIRPVYALDIMNVVVTMTAVSGTADETDYSFTPTSLTLSSGLVCASVSLNSDSMAEDVESFYVTLSSDSSYIDVDDSSQVKVSIYDEDSCPIDPEGSICKDILFLKLCQYIEQQSSSTLPLPCLTVRERYSNVMHTMSGGPVPP